MGRRFQVQYKVIFFLMFSVNVLADGLYDDAPEEKETSSSQHIFSGTLDFRFVSTDSAISWREGGRGLSRYGAKFDGEKHSEFVLPQATLVYDGVWQNFPAIHLQLNYSDHEDSSFSTEKFGIVEAYMEQDLSDSWHLKLGMMFPPISLEHTETGWNTKHTINASAINSWVGEELKPLAVEVNFKHKRWNFALSAFSANDPMGAILSYRGWALHDYQAVYGSRLRMQTTSAQSSTWTAPFREIDGRLGTYGKISYKTPIWALELFYLDNLADSKALKGADYAWRTHFGQVAGRWNVNADFKILAQAMVGSTKMGASEIVNNGFASYYLMPVYTLNKNSFATRFDYFKVKDKDSWVGDNNNAKGFALTFNYTRQFDQKRSLAFEYLYIDSDRPGNPLAAENHADPKDNLFQVNYRFIF